MYVFCDFPLSIHIGYIYAVDWYCGCFPVVVAAVVVAVVVVVVFVVVFFCKFDFLMPEHKKE